MTQREVLRAQARLEARGEAATPRAIHAVLGTGTRAQVHAHLRRLRERQRPRPRPTPAAPLPRSLVHTLEQAGLSRAEEAARLEAFVGARQAAGYGLGLPLEPLPALEEEDEPPIRDTRRRAHTRALTQSLLAEVAPWLYESQA